MELVNCVQDCVIGNDNNRKFQAVDRDKLGMFACVLNSALFNGLGPRQVVPEFAFSAEGSTAL